MNPKRNTNEFVETKVEEARSFVLRTKQPDRFTLIRTRVEVTPSICTEYGCNYDGAPNAFPEAVVFDEESNTVKKYPNYFDLNDEQKRKAIELLRLHKEQMHSPEKSHIITEAVLPTRSRPDYTFAF